MSIPFTCPHCGLFTEVEEQYAGQDGPCYGCGKTVSVPPMPMWAAARRSASASVAGGVSTVSAEGHPIGVGGAKREQRKFGPSLGVTATIVASVAAAVISVVAVGFWFLGPTITSGRGVFGKGACAANLERIALALERYRAEHGVFPPAYVTNNQGKRMHSWRVMILPQLDQQRLYDLYDFDKPWDSPENLALVHNMPDVFACPSDPSSIDNGETNYLVLVGGGAIFRPNKGIREIDVTDGLASTIMVVETPQTKIQWTEPADLDFEMMSKELNIGGNEGIGSLHKSGGHIAASDGQVYYLRDGLSPETIEAMGTAAGGEAIGTAAWE